MAQDQDQDQDQSQDRNQDQKHFSHSDPQDRALRPSRQDNDSIRIVDNRIRSQDRNQDQDYDQDRKHFSHSDPQDQASRPSRQINGSGGLGCNISGKMSTFITLLRICGNL